MIHLLSAFAHRLTWGTTLFALLVVIVSVQAESNLADNNSARSATDESASKDKDRQKSILSPEREAAVLTFVRIHHADLEALLIHLREARPKEYDKALRELFRVTERLGQIQDRDQDLYELELRMWKTQSRLQLLVARLQMGESDELKKQVRDTVQEQFEVKLAMLQRQEKRLSEQAHKAQEELKKLQADQEKWVARQITMLTRPMSESTEKQTSKSVSVSKTEAKSGTGKSAGGTPERQDDEKKSK